MSSNANKFRLLQRRMFIRRLAATGTLGAAGLSGFMSRALAKGDMPVTPGLNQLKGTATVNGRPASAGTPVTARDKVSTGPASEAVIVVKEDAFLLRANTTIELAESRGVLSEILIGAGSVLSVFGKKPVTIRAGKAVIGIRGTGAYAEVDPDEVYFCLCYGQADVSGPGMARPRRITTIHHESPLLLSEREGVMNARESTVKNHFDDELIMLEALVGREPPFMGLLPLVKY